MCSVDPLTLRSTCDIDRRSDQCGAVRSFNVSGTEHFECCAPPILMTSCARLSLSVPLDQMLPLSLLFDRTLFFFTVEAAHLTALNSHF